jgi:hypothetical protein
MSVTSARRRPSAVFELLGGAATGSAGLAGLAYLLWAPQHQGTTITNQLSRDNGPMAFVFFALVAVASVSYLIIAVWDARASSAISLAALWTVATGMAVLAGIAYWAFTPQISSGLLPVGLIALLVTSGVTVLRRRRAPGLPLGGAVPAS